MCLQVYGQGTKCLLSLYKVYTQLYMYGVNMHEIYDYGGGDPLFIGVKVTRSRHV